MKQLNKTEALHAEKESRRTFVRAALEQWQPEFSAKSMDGKHYLTVRCQQCLFIFKSIEVLNKYHGAEYGKRVYANKNINIGTRAFMHVVTCLENGLPVIESALPITTIEIMVEDVLHD